MPALLTSLTILSAPGNCCKHKKQKVEGALLVFRAQFGYGGLVAANSDATNLFILEKR
jgi:hypothetical protein